MFTLYNVRYWVVVLLLIHYCSLCLCVFVLNVLSSFAINSLGKRERTGPEAIKLFSYSTQLSTKFILLIIFISMISTTSEI